MPQLGVGIIPSSGSVASELTATVRRACLETLIVQIYVASPLIAALLQTALTASGGLSPVTAPVQGNSMVAGQWLGYDGAFNQPTIIPGVQNAEFNLKAFTTAIPFLGFEGLVQLDYDIVPLIEARMNDATNVTIDTFANSLYQNTNNQTQLLGLPAAVDDGTVGATYGGIARSTTNTTGTAWWKSTNVTNAAAAVTPTRNIIMQYISQVTKKTGQMPSFGIMGLGTWTLLTQDFTGNERFLVEPGGNYGERIVKSLFQALMVAGVPIYADPKCPEGVLYLLNSDYLSLYIHEKAGFQFTGFESMLSNGQFGYIGAILTLLELVNVKPQAHGKFSNLNFLAI